MSAHQDTYDKHLKNVYDRQQTELKNIGLLQGLNIAIRTMREVGAPTGPPSPLDFAKQVAGKLLVAPQDIKDIPKLVKAIPQVVKAIAATPPRELAKQALLNPPSPSTVAAMLMPVGAKGLQLLAREQLPLHVRAYGHQFWGSGKTMIQFPKRVKEDLRQTVQTAVSLRDVVDPSSGVLTGTPLRLLGETKPALFAGYGAYPKGRGFELADPISSIFSRDKELVNTLGSFYFRPGKKPNTAEVIDFHKFYDVPFVAARRYKTKTTSSILKEVIGLLSGKAKEGNVPFTNPLSELAQRYGKPYPIRTTIGINPEAYQKLKALLGE